MKNHFLRHLPPVCATSGFIVAVWVIFTLPLWMVFVIDGEPLGPGFPEFILYAGGTALAISVVILLPATLLLEWVARRHRLLSAVVPAALVGVSGIVLLACYFRSRDLLSTLLSGAGLFFAGSLFFAFYQVFFWIGGILLTGWRRFLNSGATRESCMGQDDSLKEYSGDQTGC